MLSYPFLIAYDSMHLLIQCISLSVGVLALEEFDYVYSTVNKTKKTSKQPSQEIGKTESLKLEAGSVKCTNYQINDIMSTANVEHVTNCCVGAA